MQRTNIYLEESQTEAMDALAAQQGISRAELIRRLIDEGLARQPSIDSLLSAINDSFGAARDVDFPDRSTEREDYLEGLWRS